MVESVERLREICQRPVEALNDLPGRLYGNRISIHVTRLCLAISISANTASVVMGVVGIGGAVLLAFGGALAALGFLLLELSYILDCVDGEIARYQGSTSLLAAAYDYVLHLIVKSIAYVCLGLGLFYEVGHPWVVVASFVALLATLLQKFLWDLSSILYCRKILLFPDREEAARLVDELAPVGSTTAATPSDPPPAAPRPGLRTALGTVRALFVNFDFCLLIFFAAALVDAMGFRYELSGIPANAKATVLLAVAVALPLHFVDSLVTYVRKGRLRTDLTRLTERSLEIASREGQHPRVSPGRAVPPASASRTQPAARRA